MFNPLDLIFKKHINSVIGVDIGTSSIKLVELRREEAGRFRLTNYVVAEMMKYAEAGDFRGVSFNLKDTELAQHIKFLKKEAGISSDMVVMSLPVFSTFVTMMDMPLLDEKELATAVPLQAREYIPIPISEVVLDWKLVRMVKKSDLIKPKIASREANTADDTSQTAEMSMAGKDAPLSRNTTKNREHAEILLMAAPREMVQKYVRVAQLAGLTILGLEIESFALSRSVVGDSQVPVLLLDLGGFSSSVAVFDEGFLRVVHNIAISSIDLTRACARALGTEIDRAEMQKRNYGLYASGGEAEIATAYLPLLDALVRDCERVTSTYWRLAARQVGNVVISGNAALLKGLDRYLSSRLQIPVSLANPFMRVRLPKELASISSVLGPELANAVGLAMKEV